jgi:hypothetical protein
MDGAARTFASIVVTCRVDVEMAGSRAVTVSGTTVGEATGAAAAVATTVGTGGAVTAATGVNCGDDGVGE